VEKTYFTTEEAFPTVLRRSEVVAIEIQEISPIENALAEVEQKTKELSALHVKYAGLSKTTQVVSTNALAMTLNAAVDTPTDTGISSYRQEFFNPDYLVQNPDRAEAVEKLRKAIEEQVRGRDLATFCCLTPTFCRLASSIAVLGFTDNSALQSSFHSMKRLKNSSRRTSEIKSDK
jgi:Dock homology region 2